MKRNLSVFLFLIIFFQTILIQARSTPYFTSIRAEEVQVQFQALFKTELRSLAQIRQLSADEKSAYINEYILPTVKYLYGPLTHRGYGNPQRNFKVYVDWDKAILAKDWVLVPYVYKATWLLHQDLLKFQSLTVPVPYTAMDLVTPRWTLCTDSDPSHHSMELYWYFWDPSRPGCDQKDGMEYQETTVRFIRQTENIKKSYPEYTRLIRNRRSQPEMRLTFAFGYSESQDNPYPDTDEDYGIQQYQDFVRFLRKSLGPAFRVTPIVQGEFKKSPYPNKVMGYRFQGNQSGVLLTISVVAAADVDQMEIFAKSFAQDHDSFFGWFGHSRVGWGFDSDVLLYKLKYEPESYSISRLYQIIYWAGCNSYSYYTIPFFQMKVSKSDPFGTKGLDIISNGLPSYFALNSINAKIIFHHFLNWKKVSSYQDILLDLEGAASSLGAHRVLINVLGDEDNPTPR